MTENRPVVAWVLCGGVGGRRGTIEMITEEHEDAFRDGFTGIYICENDQTIYYKYVQLIV